MSYFEGLFALLPLLVSISLRPTLKDSLLSFLDHQRCSRNTLSHLNELQMSLTLFTLIYVKC